MAEAIDRTFQNKEVAAIKLKKINGPKLAEDHPEIAQDYEDGMFHAEIAIGIVAIALKTLLTEEQRERIRKITPIRVNNEQKERGTGLYSLSTKQRSEIARNVGQSTLRDKTGIHGLTPEQRREHGTMLHESGIGIFAITPEQHAERSRRAGRLAFEKGAGIHGLSEEKKLHIKLLGCVARGYMPYVTGAVERTTGLDEKEYALYLSRQAEYQHESGAHRGRPHATKIAAKLNEVFHSYMEIRKAHSIRRLLVNERKKALALLNPLQSKCTQNHRH